MLAAAYRLRQAGDFTEVTRSGTRSKNGVVVVHVLLSRNNTVMVPRVGVVASKAVGNSVQRHAVARRLRHAVRPGIAQWPPGTRVVIRALPGAAQRSWSGLVTDLQVALHRAGLSLP
jgi:ribonuclease P protein component